MSYFERFYEVHELLGQGAMGVVYRATHRLTGQAVALKRVRAGRAASESGEREGRRVVLAREFKTLASLRHPNIVSVLDYGFDERGEPFFAMELIEDPQTLLEAAIGLPLAGRLDLLLQTLEALAYLHQRGVVHRDLKPSNVLVSAGKVKVVDFGVALQGDARRGVAGTLLYMAPELLRDELASPRSDIYAIGLLGYQMMTGLFPFAEPLADELRAADPVAAQPDLSPFGLAPRAKSRVAASFIEPHDRDTVVLAEDEPTGPSATTPLRTLGEGELTAEEEMLAALPAEHRGALGRAFARLLAVHAADRPPTAAAAIEELSGALGQSLPAQPREVRDSFLRAARFIGRERELDLLHALLRKALAGAGGACLIGGEGGIGKSRLIDELRTLALVEGAAVFSARAVAEGGPYQVWGGILRSLCLATELDAAEAATLAAVVPDVGALLRRPIAPTPTLTPRAAQQRLWAAVTSVIRKQTRPTVLLLEDLQWAGSESLGLLAAVGEASAGSPVAVIASYRDDERPDLPGHLPRFRVLTLPRLDAHAVRELSEAMLGPVGTHPELLERLQREGAGNALFVVEVARSVAAHTARLDALDPNALSEQLVSGGIRSALRARIERVSPDDRALLVKAAIIGRELEPDLLRALAPHLDLERWLLRCNRVAILEVHDGRWMFAHDKLRDALFADLPAATRRELHAEVAAAIEATLSNASRYAARLAHHYLSAELPAKAIEHLMFAGAQALGNHANQEATRFLEQALALLEFEPPSADRSEQQLDLYAALAPTLVATHGYASPRVAQAYEEARRLCSEQGDTPGLFAVLFGTWQFHLMRAELPMARDSARELLALAERLAAADLAMEAHRAIGTTLFYLGDLTAAAEHLDAAMALYVPEQHGDHVFRYGGEPGAAADAQRALTHLMLGRVDEAMRSSEASLERARRAEHPFTLAAAEALAAWLRQLMGDIAAVHRHAERVIEISTEHGFPFWRGFGAVLRGWALAQADGDVTGTHEMRGGMQLLRSTGTALGESYWMGLLAESYHRAREHAAAELSIAEALRFAVGTQEDFYRADLLRLQGEILATTPTMLPAACDRLTAARELGARQNNRLAQLRTAVALVRICRPMSGGPNVRALLLEALAGLDSAELTHARSAAELLASI